MDRVHSCALETGVWQLDALYATVSSMGLESLLGRASLLEALVAVLASVLASVQLGLRWRR